MSQHQLDGFDIIVKELFHRAGAQLLHISQRLLLQLFLQTHTQVFQRMIGCTMAELKPNGIGDRIEDAEAQHSRNHRKDS